MANSEEYGRSLALEAALQWIFFRVVSNTADPPASLDEFRQHIERQRKFVKTAMDTCCENRDIDGLAEAGTSDVALEHIRDSLCGSIELLGAVETSPVN